MSLTATVLRLLRRQGEAWMNWTRALGAGLNPHLVQPSCITSLGSECAVPSWRALFDNAACNVTNFTACHCCSTYQKMFRHDCLECDAVRLSAPFASKWPPRSSGSYHNSKGRNQAMMARPLAATLAMAIQAFVTLFERGRKDCPVWRCSGFTSIDT